MCSDDPVELALERDMLLIESEWISRPMHRLVAREEDRGHHLVYTPVDLASEDRIYLSQEIIFLGISYLLAML
jgi:hypothetical protein